MEDNCFNNIVLVSAIHQHESAMGVHVFPILNPPPTSLMVILNPPPSQCTSLEHPVSCIKPGLATRSIYDIIRISMPFSQIIPPSPSPRWTPKSPKDCSIHQCLFCYLIYRVIVTIFLNSIYMLLYTVLVFFFDTSATM